MTARKGECCLGSFVNRSRPYQLLRLIVRSNDELSLKFRKLLSQKAKLMKSALEI